MAYGRPAHVRSHRRGGPRRRPRIAPWISIALAVSLLVGAVVVGYLALIARACSGETTTRIIASPSTATLLESLGAKWAATEPSVDGTCAKITVEAKDSAATAAALTVEWDTRTEGEPPDVWVPASTVWMQKAAASDIAEPMMPDLRPSIARTPTVIAMPRAMAEALDWPGVEMQWETLLDMFGDGAQGWAGYGHPEWGEFRFGMTDPARSTAGLLALSAILDSNDDGEVDRKERRLMTRLGQLTDAEIYYGTTDLLLTAFDQAASEDPDDALQLVSAFPALEQDVLLHNQHNPLTPLSAIYPTNGNIEADHPYLVLDAPWATGQKKQVAEAFLAYVRGPEGQQLFRDAGFRGPNRETGEAFTEQNGLSADLVTLPRTVPVPESVTSTIESWTALTRPTNMLLVLDVSGSMREEVPGTGDVRLDRARDAARQVVELFAEDARVGLWEFSTARDGNRDYRTLVALGQLDDALEDGRDRREHALDAIAALTAAGDTGLYNAIAAAHDTVVDNYDENATNAVVVLTDGRNETDNGISLEDLLTKLRDGPAGQPVQVITVGFGEEIDFEVLREISETTGARANRSADGFDLDDVLLSAVFDTVP